LQFFVDIVVLTIKGAVSNRK